MRDWIKLFAMSVLLIPVCSCQQQAASSSQTERLPELAILDAASQGRDGHAESVVAVNEVSKSVAITSTTNYPIWRENISAMIDSTFVPTTTKFVSARVLPKIYIYMDGEEEPGWWSVIDLSTSFALDANLKTLLVLPVGSQKSISSPISKLKWARIDEAWPSENYYHLVPSGKHQFQLVLEIYDDKDNLVDSVKTEKQSYESVFSREQPVLPKT